MRTMMIEGVWRGYTARQDHVCYREYTNDAKLIEAVSKMHAIHFTDGTALILSVREKPRKREPAKQGYGDLVRKCVAAGVDSVAALYQKSEVKP